jgi:chemotaxis protein methyltransferase CheR
MSLSPDDIALVRRSMLADAGLVLDVDKDYLVESRLMRLARQQGTTVPGLLHTLRREGSSALRYAVVEQMAIKETYFFRDPWMYEALREELIPDLMRRHARSRRLSLWCAAAATGQEIYSICLLLLEHFPALADWHVTLMASDFSAAALAQAESGRYSLADVNRGLPARLLTQHFTRAGLDWQISDSIREMVQFRSINLVGEWPSLPTFDIVLMRNVLIYFEPGTRQRVLAGVHRVLGPHGCLILGGGETPAGASEGFRPHPRCRGCYERMGGGVKEQ